MQYESTYIIRPKTSLLDRIANLDLPHLEEPVLWKATEGGRSVWMADDHIEAVKVVFIAALQHDLDDEALPGWVRELAATAATFDQWWTIERFMSHDAILEEEVDILVSGGEARKLAMSGSKLVEAMLQLRERQGKK